MAPLALNPALTGAFQESNWRLNLIHRRQWETFLPKGGGYETYLVSTDRRLCLPGRDFWGVGVTIMHDRAGFSPLESTSAVVSASYHKILSSRRDRDIYLAAGAELGWLNYRLTEGNFRFDEQFDNPSIPDEITGRFSTGMFSGGVGLYFVSAGNNRSDNAVRAGVSIRHLNRPKFQFFEEDLVSETHLNWHVTGHFAWVQKLGGSRFSAEPSVVVKYQRPYWQCLVGANFLMDLKGDNFILHAGPSLRVVNDVSTGPRIESLVANVQVDFHRSTLSFSFDANLSPLAKVSGGVGGFEFAYMQRFGGEACKLVMCPW